MYVLVSLSLCFSPLSREFLWAISQTEGEETRREGIDGNAVPLFMIKQESSPTLHLGWFHYYLPVPVPSEEKVPLPFSASLLVLPWHTLTI